MKQTRQIIINERVFTAQDLMRMAEILDAEKKATPDEGHVETTYEVRFGDNTRFESDTPEVFQEELLESHGRPVAIERSFHNYTRGQHITVSLSHGDLLYRNEVIVRASEAAWVKANFQSFQDVLNRVRPQTVWFRRHKILILNLIALGVGSMFYLSTDALEWLISRFGRDPVIFRPPPSWVPTLSALSALPWVVPMLLIATWVVRWFIGLAWGAFAIQRWLLNLWPSIEFDFGLPHYQFEKIKRERLWLVIVLIVVPIVTSLLYDLLKRGL